MGFKSMFKNVKNSLTFTKKEKAEPPQRDGAPTRWEKAVIGMNAIVSQVAKFDPGKLLVGADQVLLKH